MKKTILITLMLLGMGFAAGVACAQEVAEPAAAVTAQEAAAPPAPEPSTNLFNFGDFFKSIRIGYAVDQHGARSSVFYTSILTYHTAAAVDLVSFNIGYEGILKRPTLMMGVRMDNIVPLMVSGTWGKKHIKTATLPSFEAGPFLSFWPKSSDNLWVLEVRYGLGAAIGF